MDDVEGLGKRIKSSGEPNSRKYFICCRLRGGSDDDGRRSFVGTIGIRMSEELIREQLFKLN
jgi:hypothetical protein